jgi:hypothetical protein
MALQRRTKRRVLLFAGSAILLAAVVVSACVFLRISSAADVKAYRGMASECHPVWKEFALRRFKAGDSAAELFHRFPPNHKEEFGWFGVYSYYQSPTGIPFTGLGVITRDGKLLSARTGSCTWKFSFFHVEDAELNRTYASRVKAKMERRRLEWLDSLEAHLRKFYLTHTRWPTNQHEFNFFATGARSRTTNDCPIILIQKAESVMELGLLDLPNDKRIVTKPE